MVAKKKGGGGNLTRSQVVTVRLDPKLKFAAELAARKQRRTISSFIEWAVEEAITRIEIREKVNVNTVMNQVWHVEDADRLVKLAFNFPELLTYEEEKIWNVIKAHKPFWTDGLGENAIDFKFIRDSWLTIQQIVEGEATEEDLCPF